MSLKRKTIVGLKWTALQQIVTQLSTFVVGVVLMRLLTPSDFGLIAMVTVLSSFLAIFQSFGLTSSLIQKKDLSDDDSQVIFWIMLSSGIILSLIFFFSAGLISEFYDEPKVKLIAQVLSINFVIGIFGSVNSALLRRDMKFREISVYRTISVIVGGIIAIILAYKGFGVWSLVVQNISVTFLTSLLIGISGDFRPKMKFEWISLKEHLNFGLPLFGSRTIKYFSGNSDRLIIGKVLTKGDLGVYSRAYNLLFLPIRKISMVFSSVLFSGFSKIRDNKEKIAEVYLSISVSILTILSPFLITFFFFIENIVILLFGEKWRSIIELLEIFTFLVPIHCLSLQKSNIYLSQGKTKYELYFNVIGTILDISAILIGVFISLKWVAINILISEAIKTILATFWVGKALEISPTFFVKRLFISLIHYFILFVAGYTIVHLTQNIIRPDWLQMAILLIMALIFTYSFVRLADRKTHDFILTNLKLIKA